MSLRQRLAELHGWAGLASSWLLFVILFSGSLACFDKEIERWMRPLLHTPQPIEASAQQVLQWLEQHNHAELHAIWMQPPAPRQPYWRLIWETASGVRQQVLLDPQYAQPLPASVGGEFFLTLHWNLHSGTPGMYLVGLAGMLMLVALLSGLLIHRRLIRDFFTFRRRASAPRAWLDLHNLAGVSALPFHLFMAYSGVAIMVASYMPAAAQWLYGSDLEQFAMEASGSYHRDELQRPGPASLPMQQVLEQAQALWNGAPILWINIEHPDDASAVIQVRQRNDSTIASPQQHLYFAAENGALLHHQQPSDAYQAYTWMTGLHKGQFAEAPLRLLYLLLGLAGCLMLLAGNQLWLRKRQARDGQPRARLQAINAGVFQGLPLACLALLWSNRLLPQHWPGRDALEAASFALTWLGYALCCMAWRHHPARGRRWYLFGGLAIALPLLAPLQVPGHLLTSLANADWALAAIDLALLGAGLVCLYVAQHAARGPRTC